MSESGEYKERESYKRCYIGRSPHGGFYWARPNGERADDEAKACLLASVVTPSWDGDYREAYLQVTGDPMPDDLVSAISSFDFGEGNYKQLAIIIAAADDLGIPLVVKFCTE